MVWSGWYPPQDNEESRKSLTPNNAFVKCAKPPSTLAQCTEKLGPCLFDLSADPCEYENQADKKPFILERMLSLIEEYKKGMVPIRNKPNDPIADPAKHGWVWTAWQ